MESDVIFLQKLIEECLSDIQFNQVSLDFKVSLGNMVLVPQYNRQSETIMDYGYDPEKVKITIEKRLGLVAASRIISDSKDHAKPLIAQVLLELKDKIGVAHYEQHCGKYLKIVKVNELRNCAGYEAVFECQALPFDKSLCKTKSLHDKD